MFNARQPNRADIHAVRARLFAGAIAGEFTFGDAMVLSGSGAVKMPFSLSMNRLRSTVRLRPSATKCDAATRMEMIDCSLICPNYMPQTSSHLLPVLGKR